MRNSELHPEVRLALNCPNFTSDRYLSIGLNPSLMTRFFRVIEQLDFVGLVLLGAAVALILLPLTLAEDAKGQWKNRTSSQSSIPSLVC